MKIARSRHPGQAEQPARFESNVNVKLFRALSHLIMEAVPTDPGRDEFRQGNTLVTAYQNWQRVKIGRRFQLFFRNRTELLR